jgi:hypothetical protein
MAYVREEKEDLEVSYPLDQLWIAIPKVIEKLEWKLQEKNEETHYFKVKTKGAFLSYASMLNIGLSVVNEKTTRMTIAAETPVTTITSMADMGRTRERINQLIVALAKLMSS